MNKNINNGLSVYSNFLEEVFNDIKKEKLFRKNISFLQRQLFSE